MINMLATTNAHICCVCMAILPRHADSVALGTDKTRRVVARPDGGAMLRISRFQPDARRPSLLIWAAGQGTVRGSIRGRWCGKGES
jgi:hypothetical protein